MSSFADQAYAGQFRDWVTRIAKRVVQDERPDIRLGKVYSFNEETQFVQILFAGDTVDNTVKVRAATNMRPAVTMDTTFDTLGYDAPGDIVRVAGRPGAYFVADFYSGVPKPAVNPGSLAIAGEIKMWPSVELVTGYLLCDGSIYDNFDYPDLAVVIGNTFGGIPGESFGVPDFRGRLALGSSSAVLLNSNEGVTDSALRNLSHTHSITHDHVNSLHNHGLASDMVQTKATNTAIGGTATRVTDISGTTGDRRDINESQSTSNSGAQPNTGTNSIPYLGINFIIKT